MEQPYRRPRWLEPANQLAFSHSLQAEPDWQYATTHHYPVEEDWPERDTPPDGAGWIRNKFVADEGYERRERIHVSYWMRYRPGMTRWDQPKCGPRGPLNDITPSQWRKHLQRLKEKAERAAAKNSGAGQ